MDRNEYKNELKAWEAEGYDVSELREKWFPPGRSHAIIWLSILLVIVVVASGVVRRWMMHGVFMYVPMFKILRVIKIEAGIFIQNITLYNQY